MTQYDRDWYAAGWNDTRYGIETFPAFGIDGESVHGWMGRMLVTALNTIPGAHGTKYMVGVVDCILSTLSGGSVPDRLDRN